MPPELSVPAFSAPALAVTLVLVAYLVLCEPRWGKAWFERMKRDRDVDPNAYTRFFGWGMVGSWLMAGLVLVAVLMSPQVTWAHVGLSFDGDWETLAGVLVGLGVAGAVLALLAVKYGISPRILEDLRPRNRRERGYAAGASVTAGICEEIVFRGLFIAVGVSLGLPVVAAAGLSLAVFTLAHLYQGPRAMAGVGVAGLALTFLYLSTGSLLLPIIAHAAVDLRGFLLSPKPRGAEKASAPVATAA
ncbi:CPBP family intramembrane glutamic endopeptidase [Nocardiopsis ganjiahuensis]|uniref:CPBP family intramembrane glutamic endopeptidase n=1 Tax=Nocardiopsis ganjiahuensis TaxID=239984 RepID=UPI0003460A91|nr:CPBP family intramembrane glutamic endopeptidase [Nocardiopsis ganjiahuensis]